MLSPRILPPLAALFLGSACQPSTEQQELLPLSDASNAISTGSAPPRTAIDAGVFSPPPVSPEASVAVSDGGVTIVTRPADAALPADAAAASDAADSALSDAATIGDAATVPDAATVVPDAATADGGNPGVKTGTCGGSTPHGCWPPKAGNPMGCPAQIHEQSEYYPPLDEWVSCESPYYERCIYLRPDGSEAYCACDLGVHWLCTY